MKKKDALEAILYITIIIFSILMWFKYEPGNIEYEVPKVFEIIESGDNE